MEHNPSRREFLRSSGVLTIAFYLSSVEAQSPGQSKTSFAGRPVELNAFVRVNVDNTVTIVSKHNELGQGAHTGMATLIAEELDAAWSQIRVQGAPAADERYNHLEWHAQATGGSSSIAESYEQMRKAGAAARAMLVSAAAAQWGVAADQITVRDGVLSHSQSGRRASFGELTERAASMPVPSNPALKDPKNFRLIGKKAPRKDSREKTNGSARYASDVNLPGMLTAVVAHPPLFGAKIRSFDARAASKLPGVVDVVQISTGVAVVASSFWAAKQGRDALIVQWDETAAFRSGSTEVLAEYRALATKPGRIAKNVGDVETALEAAARRLDWTFDFPFLAHATMEPMSCAVQFKDGVCEIWNGVQSEAANQAAVAPIFGVKPAAVKINSLYAGGSFGRRASPHMDYLVEGAQIVKALGKPVPVKLLWTREDDTRAGFYRPLYHHAIKAGMDSSGKLVAWRHRIVGQSVLIGTSFEKIMVKDGLDSSSVEGAANLPYEIPHFRVDLHTTQNGVPIQWWRSVGSTHTAFSTEVVIDELAAVAGLDSVEFRRQLLTGKPRHRGVLDLAASKAGWGKPLPKNRGRGVALHESFNSFVAQVAEVTVLEDGGFRVDRVVCAVDCGVAVNPDVIKAQMEGGIAFGLSAALHGAITIKEGRVEQSNFHDYRPLRINEMPKVEVHIVPSLEKPTGVGEPGVPPIAPAVANALAMATGKRLRNLPLVLA